VDRVSWNSSFWFLEQHEALIFSFALIYRVALSHLKSFTRVCLPRRLFKPPPCLAVICPASHIRRLRVCRRFLSCPPPFLGFGFFGFESWWHRLFRPGLLLPSAKPISGQTVFSGLRLLMYVVLSLASYLIRSPWDGPESARVFSFFRFSLFFFM